MSESPHWVRFFASDWLAGTRGMTAAESGVYITLIALMYERGGSIVNDHARLARLCGASNSQFKTALATLIDEGKLTESDGYLTNNRVVEELFYSQKKSEVAKEKANSRWHKKGNEINATLDAVALQQHCSGNATNDANQNQNQNQNQNIITPDPPSGDHPPTTSGPVAERKSSPKAKRGTRIPDDWCLGPREREVALEEGLIGAAIEREAKNFALHYQNKTGQQATKIDWLKAWRQWCIKSIEYAERRSRYSSRPPDKPKFRNGFAEILFDMNAEQQGFYDDEPDRNTEPEIIPPDRGEPRGFSACGPDIRGAGGQSLEPVVVDFPRYRTVA